MRGHRRTGMDAGIWICRTPPNAVGRSYSGDLRRHNVLEHEDGTISVSPSIQVDDGEGHGWHGYLERGVWRTV